MGSQPSKQETAIEACLTDFPDHERTYVLALFEKLCKGVITAPQQEDTVKKGSHDQDTIDPQHFNAFFSPLLPPPLLTCFRVTMQMHSAIHESSDSNGGVHGGDRANRRHRLTRSTSVDSTSRISKYGWVMTIHRLCKTSIEEQAELSFMLQTHDKSLESFISNVTRAVMVLWLAGEVESWKDIPEEDVEGTTGFLLTRHLTKNSGRNELESDDEDESAPKDGLSKAGQDWLETATKRDSQGHPTNKEMSRSTFLQWYQQTVEYQILFTILIQNLFLGQPTLPPRSDTGSTATDPRRRIKMPAELENKLCQKNYIAPRFKDGIDIAPHFSRLLTVADFFQLRYALPTPIYNMTASAGATKKGSAGGGGGNGGGLEQSLSETRPTPPFRLLFSSKTSGASFSTLLQTISYQGPTLVIMKDEDGYIFGAYADQDWEQGPKFYGTDRTFLFTIRPTFRIYRPSQGINENYQYLDSGTKTLPNGIGFGGQLRYFGLWLASDFQSGHSAAEPLCSTFQSPRLSKKQNFKLDEMEVWQIHPSTIEQDDLPKHSAMDAHPDAVALLEMANRKMYSKDVRAPENVYDSD
ncbi:hypothetical protein FBU30_003939 [Linnemannia zychae]|nr:hypothetical protein FBU30_003939 [Linnemannia zychae]